MPNFPKTTKYVMAVDNNVVNHDSHCICRFKYYGLWSSTREAAIAEAATRAARLGLIHCWVLLVLDRNKYHKEVIFFPNHDASGVNDFPGTFKKVKHDDRRWDDVVCLE